jgi:hypothetical protein
MKLLIVFISLLFILTSCTSEYNERIQKAIHLKKELNIILQNVNIGDKALLSKELTNQIQLQAQISGNEIQFYKDLEDCLNH